MIIPYRQGIMTSFLKFYQQYIPELHNLANTELDRIAIKCVIHDDKHPSVTVYLDTGVYYCPVCGGGFSPTKFLYELYERKKSLVECKLVVDEFLRSLPNDEQEILQIKDAFIKTRPQRNTEFEKIHFKSLDDVNSQLPSVQEYLESRKISYGTLEKLKIGYANAEDSPLKVPSLVIPTILDGKLVGLIYRGENGKKHNIKGSYKYPFNVDSIPAKGDLVAIVEGHSDTIKFVDTFPDIPCIGTPGNDFSKEWAREFTGIKKLIGIPQEDEAANLWLKKLTLNLGNKFESLPLAWGRRQTGKDLTDWLLQNDVNELKIRLDVLRSDKLYSGFDMEQFAFEKREFIIEGLLARQEIAFIAGPEKSYKTWVALELVKSAIDGTEFMGLPGIKGVGNCNVLFIEEEGDKISFSQRITKVMGGVDWQSKTHWLHHQGVKFDSLEWIKTISDLIYEHKIDLIIADPFQDLHNIDEDKAGAMGVFWNNVHYLTTKYPTMAMVILAHFNKEGTISDKFRAIRGSSRSGGSADVGMFVQIRGDNEPQGIKMLLDGRTLNLPNYNGIIKLTFESNTCRLSYDPANAPMGISNLALLAEMRVRKVWKTKDASIHLNINTRQIKKMCLDIRCLEYIVSGPSSRIEYHESLDDGS